MSRRTLIAGNWKMNGLATDGVALARAVAERLQASRPRCDLLVCPPFTLIARIAEAVAGSGLAVGGQDCHAQSSGAHTGDVAAAMLKDAGASAVILGHSERRADHGESDVSVRAKVVAAHAAGLLSIVCVGETEPQRDAGQTLAVVAAQLAGSLPDGAGPDNTSIAYEPVWAIGTGRTPTLEQVAEVHGMIRARLGERFGAAAQGFRILYGGSMKPSNAKDLLALTDVDGGLIGGASLKADDFWAIAQSCS